MLPSALISAPLILPSSTNFGNLVRDTIVSVAATEAVSSDDKSCLIRLSDQYASSVPNAHDSSVRYAILSRNHAGLESVVGWE